MLWPLLNVILATSAAQVAGPAALSREGYLVCDYPDRRRKTCEGIGRLEHVGAAEFRSHSQVLMDRALASRRLRGIVATMQNRVTISVEGAVCGVTNLASYRSATFTRSGTALSDAERAELLEHLERRLGRIDGTETCWTSRGDGARTLVTVAGRPVQTNYTVLWIRPDQGYRILGQR